MIEATLFGVSSSQYLHFASLLFAPTLGFAFLFLLGLPLKKLPLIETGDYVPPKWLLPIFSLGSLSLLAASTAIGTFLATSREVPSSSVFVQSYHRVLEVQVPRTMGPLRDVRFIVNNYNLYSNFRLYTNGYRVFGSTSNCRLSYQCRQKSPETTITFDKFRDVVTKGRSIFHLNRLYALPYAESVMPLLVEGHNFFDLHSETSGVEGCGLGVELLFVFDKGGLSHILNINSGRGVPKRQEKKVGSSIIVTDDFYPERFEGHEFIEPYKTLSANPSYRLCERVRLAFDIGRDALNRSDDSWRANILAKRREAACEVRGLPEGACK